MWAGLPQIRKSGRDGGIRTHGPLTPSQVRYQAALHPVQAPARRRLLFVVLRATARRFDAAARAGLDPLLLPAPLRPVGAPETGVQSRFFKDGM